MGGVLSQPSCFLARVVGGNLVDLVVVVERTFVAKKLKLLLELERVHWC